MKYPLTPAGIEPATFRFVAQHLKHCATAVPSFVCCFTNKIITFVWCKPGSVENCFVWRMALYFYFAWEMGLRQIFDLNRTTANLYAWRMQVRQILFLEECNYGKFLCLRNATTANSCARRIQVRQILSLKNATTANSYASRIQLRQISQIVGRCYRTFCWKNTHKDSF